MLREGLFGFECRETRVWVIAAAITTTTGTSAGASRWAEELHEGGVELLVVVSGIGGDGEFGDGGDGLGGYEGCGGG